MTDAPFEPAEQQREYPATLPVLPLKETVVFPQSMSPLAIGQERSVRLIDDVVAGDRLLALVTAKDATLESPGWDDHDVDQQQCSFRFVWRRAMKIVTTPWHLQATP